MSVIVSGGALQGLPLGEHRRFEDGTPLASLYLSILQQYGVSQDRFGDDGTEPLLASS